MCSVAFFLFVVFCVKGRAAHCVLSRLPNVSRGKRHYIHNTELDGKKNNIRECPCSFFGYFEKLEGHTLTYTQHGTYHGFSEAEEGQGKGEQR